MPAIAIIGPDGAGKTTMTRMLEASGGGRFVYQYMGINTSSSNVALPTSRLAALLTSRRSSAAPGNRPERAGTTASASSIRPRRPVRAAARLFNRIAEEWYRQLIAWHYQRRGYVMLYDRHFIYDFAPEESPISEGLDRRIHRWLLQRFYPHPDLVVFLDAPGETLFARKGESTVESLERRRQAILREGSRRPGFVRVDATRPLHEVYDEVASHVRPFCLEVEASDELTEEPTATP
jgi:thymidylate kinase